MNKFLIGGAVAAAIIGGGAAIAQNMQTAPAMPMHRMHVAAPMTRAAVQSHVQAMFAKLDANRDGFITKDEAQAAGQQMHARMMERRTQGTAAGQSARRAQMFDRLDANHDGMITRDEFAAAPRPQGMMMRHAGMRGMGGMRGQMFERADINKDGRISMAEAQQAALARFDAMDLNHDGTVTPQERQQARQMRIQHKPV